MWCSLNSSFLEASTGSNILSLEQDKHNKLEEMQKKKYRKKVVRGTKMWNIAHIRLDTKCTLIYYI